MGHDSDEDESSSSSHHRHSSRRRRDPRQCKLAPEENSFNFRKNRMKARVQKEKKMRSLRAAAEARKRRSSGHRSNNRFDDDEIEDSGTTEDFHTSPDSSSDAEIVPFAAAEPLPDPDNPSDEDQDGSNMHRAPNGTISASSAEVLSGEGNRRQESSSSDSSEEDASVLSLRAEATPINDDTHQPQDDRVGNLERENQELREQLDHERRRSYQRQSSSNESKNRQNCSRKCKIITFFVLVILFGGAGTFLAIRGTPTPSNLPIPAKQMSIPPTFAPTSEASQPKTDPPTQELIYDAPLPEECETVRNGGRLEGEEELRVNRYNVEMDVELTPTVTVEESITAIANATRTLLIPDLVGCFGARRSLLGHARLRRTLSDRSPLYNPNRYAIANGNSTIRLSEGRRCEGQHGGPCLGVDVILHLAAKNADEKQFVFQSIIIEIFGASDLATSLNLDTLLTSMTLVDVKINVETDAPSEVPTDLPTVLPSQQPSDMPSLVPSKEPTKAPSPSPSALPSHAPTSLPSHSPSHPPTSTPTTGIPTREPSIEPTRTPTQSPTVSVSPTVPPTVSQAPTTTRVPTRKPTGTPSEEPTPEPSTESDAQPTKEPISESVPLPTDEPTQDVDVVPFTPVPTSSPLDIVVDLEPPS